MIYVCVCVWSIVVLLILPLLICFEIAENKEKWMVRLEKRVHEAQKTVWNATVNAISNETNEYTHFHQLLQQVLD